MYFNQRLAYLQNKSDIISSAVPAMVADEKEHREQLEENGISVSSSLSVIKSIDCWDNTADISVTESIVFNLDGKAISETIYHDITVYMDKEGVLVVNADGYAESLTGFCSCAYVDEAKDMSIQATMGSNLCIVNVAHGEKGYTETGINITKYGKWYGADGQAWCAMFVSWCANQANISESIVPKYAWVPSMRDFFANKGTFYLSKSQGGTAIPRVGDLFFENGTSASPGHVGIIVAVDSNYIYVVDGNCSDKVRYHTISLTSSAFVGFARPKYTTTSHILDTTWLTNATYHWRKCENCSYTSTKTKHTFTQPEVGGPYVCETCGYETYGAVIEGIPVPII